MVSISAVELRKDLEGIVKRLKRGERIGLTYRGKAIAELVPLTAATKRDHLEVLERLQRRHVNDPTYRQKVQKHIQEVYEDRQAYGERLAP